MLSLIKARIDSAETAFPGAGPLAQEALVRNVRLYGQLARALHQALPWLDRTASPTLDLGTTYFVDEMALAIVGSDVEVLSVPDSQYMYSTLSWPFRSAALKYLSTDLATGTRPIVVFYPMKEADTVLFHALIAHELGHAAADEYDLVGAATAALSADGDYATGLAAATAHIQVTAGMGPTAAEQIARWRLGKWVEELLCDALALRYLGPSYLFAFAAFVLSTSWNDPMAKHPPPTLRVSLLLEQLIALGWRDLVKTQRPDLWAWLEWVQTIPPPALDPDNKFLYEMSLKQRADIIGAAASRVGTDQFEPSRFSPVAGDLEARLVRRIVPSEHAGSHVDRRNILLAGWLYALTSRPDGSTRPDGPGALPEALSETAFNRFIGKSLELSAVAETWGNLP